MYLMFIMYKRCPRAAIRLNACVLSSENLFIFLASHKASASSNQSAPDVTAVQCTRTAPLAGSKSEVWSQTGCCLTTGSARLATGSGQRVRASVACPEDEAEHGTSQERGASASRVQQRRWVLFRRELDTERFAGPRLSFHFLKNLLSTFEWIYLSL